MKRLIGFLGKHKAIACVILIFGVIYGLISFVNHFQFRTYALDLGAYTNALYDYAHFQWNDSTVFKSIPENLLADHFDLYLILFSPLSFLFGTYTLLIVQLVSILLGGMGVYAYFNSQMLNRNIAICATIFFYSFFGVFAAVSFDYHSNVVAATMVPWFFYFVKKDSLFKASILLLFIWIGKENMSLWTFFICLGLAFETWKTIRLRNFLLVTSILSAIYFISISTFVMPQISNNGTYPHFHYSVLGNSYSEAIVFLIQHPFDSLYALFTNHTNDPFGDFVKLELIILLCLSGLPFLIKKPQYIVMLLPILFQKLFHDNISMWGIEGQYSIEFVPIMAIGVFTVIAEIKKLIFQKILAVTLVIFTVGSTIRSMDNTVLLSDKTKIRFYQTKHYKKNYDIRKAHHAISSIPKNAIISAQSPFLPHIALRDHAYQFPYIKNANYIIFSEKENSYPLTSEEFMIIKDSLMQSTTWEKVYNQEIVVLKRKD